MGSTLLVNRGSFKKENAKSTRSDRVKIKE